MRIDVLTLFPAMFEGVFGSSILGKARDKGLVELNTVNFRDYATNKHNTVDDAPYGGGGGMVLKPEPIFAAVEDVLAKAEEARRRSARVGGSGAAEAAGETETVGAEGIAPEAGAVKTAEAVRKVGAVDITGAAGVEGAESDNGRNGGHSRERTAKRPRVILMCPQGETFTQRKAEELAGEEHLIFICGHYEGYDERIREHLVTDELSIGDYVLTGGELPSMVMIDSIVRLLPGVLGNETSAVTDSFSTGLLEYPHYTRPASFRGWDVPDVLISGHHENVAKWRHKMSLLRTAERRPDLLTDRELDKNERSWLAEWEKERQGKRES
ncbi:tRNA (guanosine(37)-N1)-methyltransferase TrmD [Paenibacillus chartarius]|uniref:tRNA (guanine-N(1)-)-methyltransferase n=1 Tax=Paenibacillus chartarius TaxID=747481 RepID=A0ABV6DNU1_9BACL